MRRPAFTTTLLALGSGAIAAAVSLRARGRARALERAAFAEARTMPHVAAILSGPGDRPYLVVPAARIGCDRATLVRLGELLARRAGERPRVALELVLAPVGSGVGGPDGAVVGDGVWLAPRLHADAATVAAIVAGTADLAALGRGTEERRPRRPA